MALAVDLNKICYFLVTGASRGIGQAMAIECSKKFKPGSVIVLLARSVTGLEDTKSKILANNDKITVITCSIDLSQPTKEQLHDIINKSLTNGDPASFELALIIHNVGTIGDITKWAVQFDDNEIWKTYFSINVFSVAVLNSQFMMIFKQIKKIVVNVTSLAATSPMKSLSLYCSGKAAREMYFRSLAAENPETIVLNYSPGPVDTDMTLDLRTISADHTIKTSMMNLFESKNLLTTEQTSLKFIDVLEKGLYKSGDHVDYYD